MKGWMCVCVCVCVHLDRSGQTGLKSPSQHYKIVFQRIDPRSDGQWTCFFNKFFFLFLFIFLIQIGKCLSVVLAGRRRRKGYANILANTAMWQKSWSWRTPPLAAPGNNNNNNKRFSFVVPHLLPPPSSLQCTSLLHLLFLFPLWSCCDVLIRVTRLSVGGQWKDTNGLR